MKLFWQMNRVIYISGVDGSGKTTLLKDVETILQSRGSKTKHIWLRSPKIISKPLMAYCRLIGLTTYTIVDGIKYGKHEFYKSSIVSWLFPILQLIDFKIKWLISKQNINSDQIVLFDRFALDTLADLMVDTRRLNLHRTFVGKEFIKMIPLNAKVIVLEVDEETIKKRKIDTLHDEHLPDKINVYRIISNDLNIFTIDNSRNYQNAKDEIIKYLAINEGDKKANS